MFAASPYYSSLRNVCYECEERHVGCHGECERYLSEKKIAEENKKKARDLKKGEYLTFSPNKKRQKDAIRKWYRNYGV